MSSSSSLFRHKPFMRFWIGQMAASLAFQMLLVGMGWQICNLTDSALSLGTGCAAQRTSGGGRTDVPVSGLASDQ